MEIKTRIGGVMMNVAFAFTSDEKRDHYAAQAAITAVASAIKTAAGKASVKGMTEAEVVAAALKLKAPDGLKDISVSTIGSYVPKAANPKKDAAQLVFDALKGAMGEDAALAKAREVWTEFALPAETVAAAAGQPEPADESGDVES